MFSKYTLDTLADDVLPWEEVGSNKMKDPNLNLYFCSNAPFKFYFTFDTIIAGIQHKDPNTVVVLIDLTDYGILDSLHTRIKKDSELNPDVALDRIVFVPKMNHHHLMAMYSLSDVVLDSVYFGGDTTLREALLR